MSHLIPAAGAVTLVTQKVCQQSLPVAQWGKNLRAKQVLVNPSLLGDAAG